jgi:hypothetical protein
MAEMFVDGVVAAPAFTGAGEASPPAAPGCGVPGINPLTEVCITALDSVSTLFLNDSGLVAVDEATAGSTGMSNVQNLAQTEQNNATELRDPLVQGTAGGIWT